MTASRHDRFQLPACPIDETDYETLYAFNCRTGDYQETDSPWQEVRISSKWTEEAVYRLLPSAPDFEYGGYLTQTRIRFRRCGSTQANTPKSKACTFHSHPTSLAHADVPTVHDVYMFLAFRHLRAITVGATQQWIWDKTKATLATVRKLANWSEVQQLREVRRLEVKHGNAWMEPYMRLALKNLGLDWPTRPQALKECWPQLLREALKIKVRVFSRVQGAKQR